MNDSVCSYCQGKTSSRFRAKDINRRISNELFEYHQCKSCGLLFLRNVPQDLGAYYPNDYYYIPSGTEELARCAAPERYKLELVRQFKTSGKLIEIGPASGNFAYLAKQAGFDITAIEMSHRCCVFLRDVVGVSAIESTNEVASLREAAEADVIALWHVIEHLTAPWEIIQTAARKLKPGGVLVIAAPNPKSFQFRILKTRWVHIDAPRHVTLPSPEFIMRVAAECGLRTVLLTTRDEGSLGWNEFGWQFFFLNFFTNSYARRIMNLLGRIVSRIMAPLESREGAGTAYTMVLTKDRA